MNRVRILFLLALLVSAVLVSCSPQEVEVTRVVTETEVVTEQIEVTRVVEVEGEEQIVTEHIEVTRVVEVPSQEGRPFEGVEVNILTFVGPQVAEPLQRRAPDFAELTGAVVNVVTVPNSELYQKALTDLATGTNSYDGFLFAPQWIVDFAPTGYLEDLTERVNADEALQWDDVAPFFQDFNSYEGSVYSIPLDGDFHMMYYRTDLL